MGLLGGFKGKLIGSKTRKEKGGTSQVVCVKFNTFSEFEPGPSASTSNGNLGRNEVVRERRPHTKPEIRGFFEQKANGDVGTPPTKSTTNATTKSTTNATPATKVTASTKPPTKAAAPTKSPTKATPPTKSPTNATPPTKSPTNATPATKATVPTKSTTKATPPTKSTPATKSPTNATPPTKSPTNATPAAKATAAPKPPPAKAAKSQAPKVPPPGPAKKQEVVNEVMPTPVVVTKTLQFPLQPSDSDDDGGNFQIHFAKVGQKFGDSSDDDSASDDDHDVSPIIFSKQATSIFFGEDEEPKVMRPRHVAANDYDDLSDGSSASA